MLSLSPGQLTDAGPRGHHGETALSRAVTELRLVQEHALIRLHQMEANLVWGRRVQALHAASQLVLVSKILQKIFYLEV